MTKALVTRNGWIINLDRCRVHSFAAKSLGRKSERKCDGCIRALKINTCYSGLLVSLINSYFGILHFSYILLQRCCNLGVCGIVLKET